MNPPFPQPQITMSELQRAYPFWTIRLVDGEVLATHVADGRFAEIRSASLIHVEYQIWRRENVDWKTPTL